MKLLDLLTKLDDSSHILLCVRRGFYDNFKLISKFMGHRAGIFESLLRFGHSEGLDLLASEVNCINMLIANPKSKDEHPTMVIEAVYVEE